MDYEKLETEMKKFIKAEPTLSEEEANDQANVLAKKLEISDNLFWDLLDLMETSFCNFDLFKKCIQTKKINYR